MDPRSAARLRRNSLLTFVFHAVLTGSFFARIAEMQVDLHLTERAFALALIGTPVGVVLSLFAAPPAIARFGPRRVMVAALAVLAVTCVLGAFVTGFWGFAGVLTVLGLAFSTLNTAMNIEADRIALLTGRPMIARAHASWGFGFMVTAGLAALAIWAGLAPWLQFVLVGALTLAFAFGPLLRMPDLPPRAHAAAVGGGWRRTLPDAALLGILGFGLCAAMVEGITRNWSTIYLRDTFQAATWIAALALPALMGMQTLGRLMADTAIARLGEPAVGRLCAVVTTVGLALAGLAPVLPLAVAGFALMGLGISTASILMTNAVLVSTDRPAALGMSILGSTMNVAGFVAPPIYGFIAEAGGHRTALLALVPMAVLAYVLSRALGPARVPAAPAQAI